MYKSAHTDQPVHDRKYSNWPQRRVHTAQMDSLSQMSQDWSMDCAQAPQEMAQRLILVSVAVESDRVRFVHHNRRMSAIQI
jgi:hypothetical protein